MGRFLDALNLVDLMVISVDISEAPEHITSRRVRGEYYIKGEVIAGSPADASPVVLCESFENLGLARDRRCLKTPIRVTRLLLLLLAMA